MELKYFFKLIVRWLWLIVLIPAVAGGIVYYMNVYKATPIYEASATLFVIKDRQDIDLSEVYGDMTIGQQAVKNYSDIVKSKAVLNQAVAELGMKDITLAELASNVSVVQGDRYSFIMGIKVKNTNAQKAKDITNKVCDVFVGKINSLMNKRVVDVLDRAELPTSPINDKTKKNVIIALMGGFIFAGALVVLMEYIGLSIIKTDDDVVKYLQLPVIGRIPKTKLWG